jgi:hypothetical protein
MEYKLNKSELFILDTLGGRTAKDVHWSKGEPYIVMKNYAYEEPIEEKIYLTNVLHKRLASCRKET